MSKNEESKESEIKVILLGDSGVGKTNLINIVTGKEFNENENVSIANSLSKKIIKLNENEYKINLWDTIGQEKFRQLTKLFYYNSKIVIFVYDITSRESFNSLPNWVKEVEEIIGNDIIKGLIGNKIDLFLKEEVGQAEGEKFAKSINAEFLTVSAKESPPKLFEDFLAVLVGKYISKQTGVKLDFFPITKKQNQPKKYKKCC